MKRDQWFIMLLIAFLGIIPFRKSMGQQVDTTQLINEVFHKWNKDNTPGGLMIITKNGKEIYHRAFGLASIANRVPVTDQTVFEAASVSKQFTATAILILTVEGKIALSDDIHKYIPEMPDYGKKITIANLLTHTSGIKDWRNLTYLTWQPPGTKLYNEENALAIMSHQKTLNFAPGDRFSYSNSNFTLLAIIVERVTGESFSEFTQRNILNPAGMIHSRWRGNYQKIHLNEATGYTTNRAGQYILDRTRENVYGAAGLITNPIDLQRWHTAWITGVFGKKVRKLRLTEMKLNNGRGSGYTYGGLFYDEIGDSIKNYHHTGLVAGYRTWMAFYPGTGLSITYMSNDRSLTSATVIKEIQKIFFGGYQIPAVSVEKPVTLTKDQITAISGLYKNQQGYNTLILEPRNQGVAIKNGSMLIPHSAKILSNGKQRYVITGPRDLLVISSYDTTRYKKVEEYHPKENDLKPYVGTYYSAEMNLYFRIVLKNGKLKAYHNFIDKADAVTLWPSYTDGANTGFYGNSVGLYTLFNFHKSTNGAINSFLASMSRARNVSFKRVN